MEGKKAEEEAEELYRASKLLSPMGEFIAKHPFINYIEFDYYTVHDLTLFTVEPDFDFLALKRTLPKIIKILPSIKRIFSKPIINLKDSDDVLPVETVRVINQETLTHLSNHAQNVANLTSRGVQPRKLLTRIYEDDYGIYENLIFCNFIDEILAYVRTSTRALKDLIYANETMEFNLLERVNHLDYYLALGKLHTGYIRDFDKYYALAKVLYGQLKQVSAPLEARLKKPVYHNNKIRNRKLKLRKTNIFLMQKDYHQVYVLYKSLLDKKILGSEEKEEISLEKLKEDYFYFIQTLTIFALGHFNFQTEEAKKLDLTALKADFSFKGWKVHLSKEEGWVLRMEIVKEKTYSFIILPVLTEDDIKKAPVNLNEDEEVILASPFEEDYLKRKTVFLSVESIESFRRIQQLILKGMVYADQVKDECPFCHSKLIYQKEGDYYQCESCFTKIQEVTCPKDKKKFFITSIANLPPREVHRSDFLRNEEWLYQRKIESGMFFRNITKIDEKGRGLCPSCQEPIEKEKNR
ncbi:MAG: hypothetical protein LKJ88_04995 [Bacilli bacterium]|jgi:hypothetical protein|nr:hypothetical protein [Bacilli bacterium]